MLCQVIICSVCDSPQLAPSKWEEEFYVCCSLAVERKLFFVMISVTDFLISSANKCIQGVPGFGFIIARRSELLHCKGVSKSLSLNIYDQWEAMEKGHGKWRFTSPTHVVRAFKQAMDELAEEGGVEARHNRYCENHRVLVDGMRSLGFQTLLPDEIQSPVITSFLYPHADFNFKTFYTQLKERGFVIYPGKISQADTFRIGNIGDVHPEDFRQLIEIIRECKY